MGTTPPAAGRPRAETERDDSLGSQHHGRRLLGGVGESRSAAIRRGVRELADANGRASVGRTIVQSYRERPQSDEDDELAMASALAMTEAEPW